MAKSRVLVIDGDEWVARLLADGLRDHGFDVSTCATGSEGLNVAQTVGPDCIVTEVMISELDGASIARTIRAQQGPMSAIPIVFLTNADDVASRQAAFAAGGDVYLTKPFRVDEVAMQVEALISMAVRTRGRRDAYVAIELEEPSPESSMPGGHAIEGNIAQMSIATVLTLLEMERRSGVLKVNAGSRECALDLVAGCAIGGKIGQSTVAPLAVLREILRWKEGRFRFRPGSETAVPTNRRSIGALLIEAVRLDDESSQARQSWVAAEEVPTGRRSIPAFPGAAPVPSIKRAPVGPASRRLSRPPPAAAPVKSASRPPPAPRASRPPPAGAGQPRAVPPRPMPPRRGVVAPPPKKG